MERNKKGYCYKCKKEVKLTNKLFNDICSECNVVISNVNQRPTIHLNIEKDNVQ